MARAWTPALSAGGAGVCAEHPVRKPPTSRIISAAATARSFARITESHSEAFAWTQHSGIEKGWVKRIELKQTVAGLCGRIGWPTCRPHLLILGSTPQAP